MSTGLLVRSGGQWIRKGKFSGLLSGGGLPPGGIPKQGISPGYGILNRTEAAQDAELDAIQRVANGQPCFVRVDSTSGNQPLMDVIMPKLALRGLTPLIILYSTDTPATVDDGTFGVSQVTKWGDQCSLYELVNEPDMQDPFWPPNVYADFVKLVSPKMKAVRANIKIAAGALFNGKALENTITASTPDKYALALATRAPGAFDYFSMHLYELATTRAGFNGWDRTFTVINGVPTWYSQTRSGGNWTGDVTVRTILNANGASAVPIISTENGIGQLAPNPLNRPEAQQTAAVAAAFDAVASGLLATHLVYNMVNDDAPAGFGLLRSDGTERPAFSIFQQRAVPTPSNA